MFKKLFNRSANEAKTEGLNLSTIDNESLLRVAEELVYEQNRNANVQLLVAYCVIKPIHNANKRIHAQKNEPYDWQIFTEQIDTVSKKDTTSVHGRYRCGWFTQAAYLRQLEDRIKPEDQLHQRWVELWLYLVEAAPYFDEVLAENTIWSQEEKSYFALNAKVAIRVMAPKSVQDNKTFKNGTLTF